MNPHTKPLIVANWKMNPQTLEGAKLLFDSVKKGIKNACPERSRRVEVVICPPFIYLHELFEFFSRCRKCQIKFGAQDCFWEQKGAFTGEVSPKQLSDVGCQYIIIGHSERRQYFNETDEMISKKIKAALNAKLKPIFCIGETQEQRDEGETPNILRSQLEKGIWKISKKEIKNVAIAYEPVWAIGTGKPCDAEEAQKMGLLIRKIIAKLYSQTISEKISILYGGSVNSKNGAGYVKEARLQGLLVGGASLDPEEFVKIITAVAEG